MKNDKIKNDINIGQLLYEGKLTLKQAVKIYKITEYDAKKLQYQYRIRIANEKLQKPKYDDIKKTLKPESANKDTKTFKLWSNNQISTEECIQKFKINNHVPDNVEINQLIFVEWLDSIGYRRTLISKKGE